VNQINFTRRFKPAWDEFARQLEYLAKGRPTTEFDFPAALRQLNHHLALARSRHYSQGLIHHLEQLALAGHQQLYRHQTPLPQRVLRFYQRDFPQLVRQEWKVVVIAALLFFGSLLAMLVAIQLNPELAQAVLTPSQSAQMETMYAPGQALRLGRQDAAESDIMMFGFYLRNNTSIGFQCFAGGLLFGLGSVIFLLYNGLFIGAVAGHLTQIGYLSTFWGFVAGHSAPELTAIALSGAAGLKLGEALLLPGRQSRREALKHNAGIGVRMLYGAATLFLLAAFIEAFWSAIPGIPFAIKITVGLSLWALLLLYLLHQGGKPH
jgi:uncharacterized membrane protein SpoIIM required for sporulation